jgi:hypothetical protein
MPIIVGGVPNPVPYAPLLVAPANASYVDLAGTPTFSWTYQPAASGLTESAWALRRKVSGAATYVWWNSGTNSWQSTQVYNSGSIQSYTFPGGAWSDGNVYNWSVSTKDANGYGPYCADGTFTAQAAPVVTVNTPGGTITTAKPTVTWSTAIASGASQTGYRVVIYSAAQYGAGGFTPGSGAAIYDTGVIGDAYAASWTVPVYLADSTSFRAYVQVTETGGELSAWGFIAFTTSYLQPATPTLTATTGTDGTTGAPIVTLVVTGNDGGSTAAYVGMTVAEIQFSDDGGATWTDVRGGSSLTLPSSGQSATVIDWEAIPSTTRSYRAYVQVASPAVESLASTTATATVTTSQWWLVDPLNTSASFSPEVSAHTTSIMEQSTSHGQMGQKYPVVLSSVVGGTDGSITVESHSAAEWAALQALVTSQHVLWLTSPFGEAWYVRLGPMPGGMGGGTGNTVRQSQTQQSSSTAPIRSTQLIYIGQARP